jgi:hypothetical protein
MTEEYFGTRFAVVSGGSHKVVIPKEIVEKVWNKNAGEESLIGVCFIRSGTNVIIDYFENVINNPAYAPDTKSKATKDGSEIGARIIYKRERAIQEKFVSGLMDENDYRRELGKIHDSLYKMLKGIAKSARKNRGLYFGNLTDDSEIEEIKILFSEGDRDEECTELLEKIELMKMERNKLQTILTKLEQRICSGGISSSVGEPLRLSLRSELNLMNDRLLNIKKAVNDA